MFWFYGNECGKWGTYDGIFHARQKTTPTTTTTHLFMASVKIIRCVSTAGHIGEIHMRALHTHLVSIVGSHPFRFAVYLAAATNLVHFAWNQFHQIDLASKIKKD